MVTVEENHVDLFPSVATDLQLKLFTYNIVTEQSVVGEDDDPADKADMSCPYLVRMFLHMQIIQELYQAQFMKAQWY